MKQTENQFVNCLKKFPILFLFLFFYSEITFSQGPPPVEWQKISWDDDNIQEQPQTQDQSGEEWYYSHKNVYKGTGLSKIQVGYITVGYSSLIMRNTSDLIAARSVFNEGPDGYTMDPNDNYDFTNGLLNGSPHGCNDRDKKYEFRTQVRGYVWLNDLKGNNIWGKGLTIGELMEVIQDGDYLYIIGIHRGVSSFEDKTHFLSYNPTASHPNNNFSGTGETGSVLHLYMAKLDMNGTIMWEALYGGAYFNSPGSPLGAKGYISYGYDLIKSSNNNLIGVGYISSETDDKRPYVIEVDPANGFLINQTEILNPLIYNSTHDPSTQSEAHSIIEIGTTGQYAIACTNRFENSLALLHDFTHASVWLFDQASFSAPASWSSNPNPKVFQGQSPNFNSNIWEIKYHTANNQLLVPVVSDCPSCAWSGDNNGTGKIYRYDNNGNLISAGNNPSVMGPIGGFDLRIGVEETKDGGFVTVSTTHSNLNPPNPFPTTAQLGYLFSCAELSESYPVWDTDPLVVKFDANGNEIWRKTFDVIPGRPRTPPPGDLKQQECVYKISETEDGGYTVSGNCSFNLDDNYLFKLANDCQQNNNNYNQIFTTTGAQLGYHPVNGTVWNGLTWNVKGLIVVDPGVIFTITNSVIGFADTRKTLDVYYRAANNFSVANGQPTKIIVMPGGKLIVNNSTLKGINCGNECMWQGIEVWGSPNMNQTIINQGKVVLQNNSVIQNAIMGVLLNASNYDVDGNPTTDMQAKGGGILQALNTKFLNCRRSVHFTSYPYIGVNSNQSSIKNCSFINDAPMVDAEYVTSDGIRLGNNSFVSVWNKNGLILQNNDFICTGTFATNIPIEYHGDGIIVYDARISIYGNTTRKFENLCHAINLNSSINVKHANVSSCQFENNLVSIALRGISSSSITKNNFIIPLSAQVYIGILLSSASNFNIEQNTLTTNSFSTTGVGRIDYGIIIGNSGNIGGTIYLNTFNQINHANLMWGNNSQLTIDCNTYNIPTGSLNFSPQWDVSSGTLKTQGICMVLPASNKFIGTCNTSQDIQIFKGTSAASFDYNSVPIYTPTCYSSGLFVTSCPLGSPNNTCSSTFDNHISFQLKNYYKNKIKTLTNKIDGGNTQNLLNSIKLKSITQIKKYLSMGSEYLSDTVLLAIMRKRNPLKDLILKDVIILNSPLTASVKKALDALDLPKNMYEEINNVQKGTSGRKMIEDSIAHYESLQQVEVNKLVRYYLDSTMIDSVIILLKSVNNITTLQTLIGLEIGKGDFKEALNDINKLSLKVDLIKLVNPLDERINEIPGFLDYYRLIIPIQMRNYSYFSLKEKEHQMLEKIAISHSQLAINAQSILKLVYNEKFQRVM